MRKYFPLYDYETHEARLIFCGEDEDVMYVYTKVDTMEDARGLAKMLNERNAFE